MEVNPEPSHLTKGLPKLALTNGSWYNLYSNIDRLSLKGPVDHFDWDCFCVTMGHIPPDQPTKEVDMMNTYLNGYRLTAIAAIICVVILSAGVTSSGAQELVVEQTVISVDVIDREPVDPGDG